MKYLSEMYQCDDVYLCAMCTQHAIGKHIQLSANAKSGRHRYVECCELAFGVYLYATLKLEFCI